MAVQIPTIQELYTSIKSDLETELNINIPLFGKVFIRALAGVQAAKLKLFYLAIANVQKNIFPDTADPVSIGGTLERFGIVKLGRNRLTAKSGKYDLTITGEIGATVPAQTTFKSNDTALNSGRLFILDTAHTLVAETDTINVRAVNGGLDSKLAVGDGLTATAPIANVDSAVVVDSETLAPLSQESISEYREKIIEAFQLELQGGAASDYRIWAADAQGVNTVYPYAKSGFANEINVYVEATIADSTDGKGTPGTGIIEDVEDVIEFDPDTSKPLNERGRRALGVFLVNVLPVDVQDVEIEITNYFELTGAKQTIIQNALKAAIDQVRPFVAGADVLENKNDILSIFDIASVIQQAIPGSRFDSIRLFVGGVEVIAYTFLFGDIPFLEPVTYV